MKAAEKLGENVSIQQACSALGVSRATLYRQRRKIERNENREQSQRANPAGRALSPGEREEVRQTLCSERFMDHSPRQVYARLLDEGTYLCSERTMYRILDENGEVQERRNQRKHPQYAKPELLATGPNQVWSWDITKLKGPEKWTYYHLYVILDIYSRHTVGWMLAHSESSDLAARLIRETIEKQAVCEEQLTLHSDRGPSMKSHSVAQLLASLGVEKSHSRPHVSNDNPFSESQFKTLKYRPEFPQRFGCYEGAHGFCQEFFRWYNEEHYHSGIRLLTPAMLQYGEADRVLAARHETLQAAYAKTPQRFVQGCPQKQEPPAAVWINPPREKIDEKGPPKTHCSERPEASLTHPRPGYPLLGCVSAEPNSVSPDEREDNVPKAIEQPFEHPSYSSKNLGGLGAGPQGIETTPATEKKSLI